MLVNKHQKSVARPKREKILYNQNFPATLTQNRIFPSKKIYHINHALSVDMNHKTGKYHPTPKDKWKKHSTSWRGWVHKWRCHCGNENTSHNHTCWSHHLHVLFTWGRVGKMSYPADPKNRKGHFFLGPPKNFATFFWIKICKKIFFFACDRVRNFELLLPNTNLISPPDGAILVAENVTIYPSIRYKKPHI